MCLHRLDHIQTRGIIVVLLVVDNMVRVTAIRLLTGAAAAGECLTLAFAAPTTGTGQQIEFRSHQFSDSHVTALCIRESPRCERYTCEKTVT